MITVEEQQKLLAREVANATTAYRRLLELEQEHADSIKALRAIDFDALRFKLSEDALRVQAETWARQLWALLSHTREVLLGIEKRVAALQPDDLVERTFMAEQGLLSGLFPRDAQLPRVPTLIRVDVVRAIASVIELERRFAEIPDRLAALAVAIERRERIQSEAASTPAILHPDELARRAASRPGNVQTKAASFSPDESER